MKKILLFLLAFARILNADAQLTGVKNIPGDYADLATAISALNTAGVGSGGVTLNVLAGNTQTGLSATLQLTATGTSANRITIQGNGNTVNYTGTGGALDGVFVLNGSDYVTIDNFVVMGDALTEWGVALLSPTANNGCRNDSVMNMNITLVKTNTASVGIYSAHHTNASLTPLTVTAFSGTNSYNKFLNNRIQNVYNGYSLTGFPAAAPYDLYDQQNEIGKTTGSSAITNFGGVATLAQGVSASNQNKLKIYGTNINNAGGTLSTGTLYGITLGAGFNSDVDVYNDTISLTSAAASTAMYAIISIMGGTGAGNRVNMYNNLVQNCNYTGISAGEFRGIYSNATATYTNMYNNTITNNTINTTGNISAIYFLGGSTTLNLKTDIYNNTITNNFRSASAGGTSGFYGIYANTPNFLLQTHDNIINNNGSSATNNGPTYGYYNNANGGINELVYNNRVSNLTGGPGFTIGIFASTGNANTYKSVYNNQIYNLTGGAQTGAIFVDFFTDGKIYKNNIYNISGTANAGTPCSYGINIGPGSVVNGAIYNNFISELKAPNSTSINSVYGLWLQGNTAALLNVYNNSVYLNATSSSATSFGSAAAFLGTNPADIILRNNILVNVSTPGPTGGASAAIVKGSTAVTNYDILSSYNCLYAGTPAANSLIYSDGTNNDQTLAAFLNRVNPREHASFTELPPFVNVAASPHDLHINPTIATQCESGGTPIALVATDYDGNARFNNAGYPVGTFTPTASDVGADEFGGNAMNDIAAPRIDYTLLGSDIVTPTRTLTSFATITDPSGVNVAAGTKPRLYYKKSANANTFNDNTNLTDGWKYVEASNAASPFSFTIDYSLLPGGTTSAADIIQYFVIAQDLSATPNVSMNAGGLTLNPASVNLAAANFPITGAINQYTIVANAYAGAILVGSAETITSLTNAGGLFERINQGVVSGDITATITSDLAAETGTVALNEWKENGTGNYKLRIVPDGTTIRTISGTSAGAALIRLDGADRTTIDGRFAGTGNYLRIRNLTSSGPGILLFNDAQFNIIRNTIIESGNVTAVSPNVGGAIQIGNSNVVNGNGNDNNIITYNEIRDRSDVAGTPNIGIMALGSATGPLKLYNDNNIISNNNIHDFFGAGSTTQAGIHIGTGNTRFNIDSNSIYQTAARVYTLTNAVTRGMNITQASGTDNYGGFNIRYNYIGGTSPNGGTNGNYWTMASGGTTIVHSFNGMAITTGTLPTVISNNVIKNIDFTSVSGTVATGLFYGISTASGNYDLNNNQIGASTGNDSLKITLNVNTGGANNTSFLAGIVAFNAAGSATAVTANKVGSITMAGAATAQVFPQLLQVQGTPAQSALVTGNLIGSTSTPNSIQINFSANPQTFLFGIRSIISNGADINFSGNTVQNITDNSTNANSQDFGILLTSAAGNSVSPVITNNVIKEFAGKGAVATFGISVQSFSGTNINISSNNISGLRSTNTGALNPVTIGIYTTGNTSGGNIGKNKMFDFSNTATGAVAGINGINTAQGNDWTVSNNMVSINNGANTNNMSIYGIVDQSTGGSFKAFYNSVYVGGNTTGSQNSYGFVRYSNAATSLKNNLFVIDRIGGTGFSYAIANDNAVPTADGWPAGASSYNTFITPTGTNVGEWNNTAQSFAGWKTVSGGDLESYADLNSIVSVSNLYSDAFNGDLTIKTGNPESWYVNGKGIAGSASGSLASDFAGNARGTTVGTPTDIGANEFTPGAGVFPPDNSASAAPAISTTTNYTFGGRPIGSIIWGATGTVPTAVTWKYYSGAQPLAGAINSYQDVPTVGGSGYMYDIKQYFTTAEQAGLPDASLQGIKKTGAAPWINIGGTFSTDAAGKFVTSTGQTAFSLFSLAPLGVVPVKLLSFTGNRSNGINHLKWETENELNTKEFILERSSDGNNFNGIVTKQARGYGNASYGYDDMAKLSGKFYYRLKIVDNSGRFSYSNIIILSEDKNAITFIYPNPVQDRATLRIKDDILLNTVAILMDINGREVQKITIRNSFEAIDMSRLVSGTYFLKLANKEVLKVIKN